MAAVGRVARTARRPVPVMKLSDHFAGLRVQRRKQGGRSVSLVIVRLPFRQLRAQRQQGSGTAQCLGLDTSKGLIWSALKGISGGGFGDYMVEVCIICAKVCAVPIQGGRGILNPPLHFWGRLG